MRRGAGDHLGAHHMTPAYIEQLSEIFDRAAVPKEIADLLDEWPNIDPQTARLIRAAIMSGNARLIRCAWAMLAARAELIETLRPGRR
jgi:hypothetical protein